MSTLMFFALAIRTPPLFRRWYRKLTCEEANLQRFRWIRLIAETYTFGSFATALTSPATRIKDCSVSKRDLVSALLYRVMKHRATVLLTGRPAIGNEFVDETMFKSVTSI